MAGIEVCFVSKNKIVEINSTGLWMGWEDKNMKAD